MSAVTRVGLGGPLGRVTAQTEAPAGVRIVIQFIGF